MTVDELAPRVADSPAGADERYGAHRAERAGRTPDRAPGQSGRSERTVRQHAVSVYQKSGRGGRAGLAAFFLGDLILPAAGGEG